MHPWSGPSALSLADEIRGPVKQGTLWRVPDELVPRLRKGLFDWLAGALLLSRSVRGPRGSNRSVRRPGGKYREE